MLPSNTEHDHHSSTSILLVQPRSELFAKYERKDKIRIKEKNANLSFEISFNKFPADRISQQNKGTQHLEWLKFLDSSPRLEEPIAIWLERNRKNRKTIVGQEYVVEEERRQCIPKRSC